MDINSIWNYIVTTKIQKDDTYKFTLKEIEAYSQKCNMNLEEFCTKIFKLNATQVKNLKKQDDRLVKCVEYKRIKQAFFEKEAHSYRIKIIKEKIKKDYSNNFSKEELEEFSTQLGVNINDLGVNILNISKRNIKQIIEGKYKSTISPIYDIDKKEYLDNISEKILNTIWKEKIKNDFTKSFTYDEVVGYVDRFGINIKDFLGEILGIVTYGKWNRPITEHEVYLSDKYKEFKDKKTQEMSDKILDSFIVARMKRTGSCRFSKEEIEILSKTYHINIRDLMMYVLGKSEQLYYDLKADRIKECFSNKYKAKKEELIISKRENFMRDINPNVRTYYSVDELEKLASALEISVYDLVVNVMQKSSKNYRFIETKNRKKVFVGSYNSGPLPDSYCKKNIEEILEILKIATKSAIGYMSQYGFYCSRYYQDLVQNGYLYLLKNGNPMDKDNNLLITSNEYKKSHGGIFYKKAYFNAIANIRSLSANEIIGEAYDVQLQTRGICDEISDEEDTKMFINNLTEDNTARQILKFFTENLYDSESIKEVCSKFKVKEDNVQQLFNRLREKIACQSSEIER